MSKLQILPVALPNKGISLDKPEEFLKNQYSTGDSRNMEFYNQLLQSRLGLTKFDTEVLSGPIMLIDQFWKFEGTWFLMVATTKDIYSYDFTNTIFNILTPVYNTGLIKVGTGAAADIVYGIGSVDFDGNGVDPGDFIKLGTGSATTADTWYEVSTVTAGTGPAAELHLTAAGPVTASSQFTVRKCFNGTSKDFWKARTFIDKNLGDTWCAVNGVDTPIYYTGTGQVVPFPTLPTGFTTAKFIEVWKDRLIFLWTVEGGQNQPQRERWSDVADLTTYSDLDFHDFMDDGYWITGTGVMASSHIVFRERDAQIGSYIGGDYTFDYNKSSSCAGVWGLNSLVLMEREAYYYGPDNKFHHWDMISDKVISESIYPHVKEYNPGLEQYIFGYQVEARNQIRWLCPHSDTSYNNEVIVYDYIEDIINIWEYEQAQACCSIGEYLNTTDLYLDDAIWGEYYLDEQEGFFDDRTFLDGAPIIIYGGYDGIIRKADTGTDDDGTDYNRVFEGIRDNFKMPHKNKRLWKQQFWFTSQIAGSLTIKIKKDDSNTFEAETHAISMVDADRDILKKSITWNKHAENFKLRIESTSHWSLLGWLSYVFQKGGTVK
jgi:hypothetical protein